jgi:drug/metabolite transporter (DMT)-like permease
MEPQKTSFFSGPLLIVIAAVLWSVDGITRRALGGIPPITIVFFEHLVGLIIILPFVWKGIFKKPIARRDFWTMAFVALFSSVLGTLWFTTALLRTSFISFSVVFLLQKLQPIFAISTAAIFLKERPSRDYWIWAVVSVVAAYFVTFPGGVVNMSTGADTVIAALFAVGAAFAWGSSTAFSKMVLTNRPANESTGLRFLMATIMAGVLALAMGAGPTMVALTGKQILFFVIIALTSGMVGLYIYYKGLRTTSVHISTILELVYPLIAVIIGIFLYNDKLVTSQWIAAAVLVFGTYMIARQNKNS